MFASRISVPSGDFERIVFAPVLHLRWAGDGSAVTPTPEDRPASPATIPASGPTDFTLNDESTGASSRELAVSVSDAADPASNGPLFRSGKITGLPASLPNNPNAVVSIALPDAVIQTIEEVNKSLVATLADGPMATSDPAVTVTGVVMTSNPNLPASWIVTVFGAYTGSTPVPGLDTLFYRYSAEFSLKPRLDPFDTTHIVTTILQAPSVVFTDAPGGAPLLALPDSFVSGMFNLLSPIIAVTMEDTVASAIDGFIDKEIRDRVSAALGIKKNADGTAGPLPANVTVSAQRLTIAGDVLTAIAAVGGFGPIVPPSSSTSCSLALALALTAAALILVLWFSLAW